MRIPEYRVDFGGAITSRGSFRVCSGFDGRTRTYSYEVDDHTLAEIAYTEIPPAVLDLVGIFRGLALLDRRTPRTHAGDVRLPEQRGSRRLIVTFPVREAELWRTAKAIDLLSDLVWVLGRDHIEINVVPFPERGHIFESQHRLQLDVSEEVRAVTLLSPGIDSLFGLINCTGIYPSDHTLAVSVNTHHRQEAVQSKVVNALRTPAPWGHSKRIQHTVVSMSLTPDKSFRESSQRFRILSFLASGILGAVGVGRDRLVVSENGPGALNLSGSVTLGGPQLNRAMHPATLRLVARLVSLAIGKPFKIENISLHLTKRQMVTRLRSAGYADLIDTTVSCDQFPYYTAEHHCGRCSSCLFRALALLDMSSLFDRVGPPEISRNRRLADLAHSLAFTHLKMLGWRLDDTFHSVDPLKQLGAADQRLSDVLRAIDGPTLLAMLEMFRNDIADLECVIEGEAIGSYVQGTMWHDEVSGS